MLSYINGRSCPKNETLKWYTDHLYLHLIIKALADFKKEFGTQLKLNDKIRGEKGAFYGNTTQRSLMKWSKKSLING